MQRYRYGFTWKTGVQADPALLSATDVSDKHVQNINNCRNPHWVLDVSFTGHGTYRIGDQKSFRERKPNTVHLYEPGVPYWENTRTETGMFHSAWAIFSGGRTAGLDALVGGHRYAQFFDPTARLGAAVREIAGLGQKYGEYCYWRVQGMLCRIFHLLKNAEPLQHEDYRIRHDDEVAPASDFVLQVEQFIRNHLTRKISIRELAKALHTTPSTLSHRFKRERGSTPVALQHRLRIDYAKELILRGMTLGEIADHLGYSDEFHLSKTFRKLEGRSPRAFKQDPQRVRG